MIEVLYLEVAVCKTHTSWTKIRAFETFILRNESGRITVYYIYFSGDVYLY